jgi:hypothetical protein
LVLIVSFGLSGCSNEVNAQVIVSNTTNNITALHTVTYTQSMQMVFEVTGGSKPGNVTTSGVTTGSTNLVTHEDHSTSNINMSTDKAGVAGTQHQSYNESTDTYIIGGWMYEKLSVPGIGDQWYKTKLHEDAWNSQNQLGQQGESLKTARNVIKLGTEKVDGVDCYMIQYTPGINSSIKLGLLIELNTFFDLNSTRLDVNSLDWGNIIKYCSVKVWISKDKYLVVKSYADISFEILPQDIVNTTIDMDRITMNVSSQIKDYDHNKPVDIQLPPEAQNAKELPSS